MINRSTDFTGDTRTTGFAFQRVYSFRDGRITAVELLLPDDAPTVEHLSELKIQAELEEAWFETHEKARPDAVDLKGDGADSPSSNDKLSAPGEGLDALVEPTERPGGGLLTACINREDVLAELNAASGNTKLSERDRTNAMKALTKKLLDRPMTRRLGVPADVHAAMARLAQLAPHIPELVETLRIPLMVAAATGAPPVVQPILLVGPAGAGKSHVALQLAEVLGVTAHTVSYAASGAVGNVLTGSDKHWGNSSIGLVFKLLCEGEFANPVVCLDELDKASPSTLMSGAERHPLNELLALLEPSTAREHRDRCAEIRVDARHIVWVATANSLAGLSAPLLSRFKLIMVGKPDARASVTIALSVAAEASAQLGRSLDAPRGEVLQLLATMTPRMMRRIWTDAAGLAIASGRCVVAMNDMERALGIPVQAAEQLH